MSEPLTIQVDSLSKIYKEGFFGGRFQALKEVSLEVKQGEIFGLLGPNGAGKTTFLKIMLGIIRKTSGSASMLGFPAGSRRGRQLVGYLPEHLRMPAHLTGYTALECFGNLANIPTSQIRKKRGELLQMVGLQDRAKDRIKKYSKGMLQRLGLAQALLNDPKLLILDEPTDGLDPRARAEMRQIIRGLKDRGVTIFLNSHLLQEVELVCDRVAILDRGHLKYCGPVKGIGSSLNQVDGQIDESKSVRVRLHIEGDPDQIYAAFKETKFDIKEHFSATEFAVMTHVGNQSEIDQLIDQLRASSVSVIGLAREEVTLEDAFLQIIGDGQADNPKLDGTFK